jgi:hypothetical protein
MDVVVCVSLVHSTEQGKAARSILDASRPVFGLSSCSTGHQVSDRPGNARVADYFKAREQKLKDQAAGKVTFLSLRLPSLVASNTDAALSVHVLPAEARHLQEGYHMG